MSFLVIHFETKGTQRRETDSSKVSLETKEVERICRSIWGVEPDNLEFPGGRSRNVVAVRVSGEEVLLAKRDSADRARLEATVLNGLGQSGLVPRLVRLHENVVVQRKLEGNRLTEVLEFASLEKRKNLLVDAGLGLIELQKMGRASGLEEIAPKLGRTNDWATKFVMSPIRLAQALGLHEPRYNIDDVLPLLASVPEGFMKWDARPGNAMIEASGAISWFDWEHCGVAPCDSDMAWLLADEWSPDVVAAQRILILETAKSFGISEEPLFKAFAARAILHTTIRLSLIFNRKGEGPWWNTKSAMANDLVGVSVAHVRRLCQRGYRLCQQQGPLKACGGLFDDIWGLARVSNVSGNGPI